jgi:hypothetical protein
LSEGKAVWGLGLDSRYRFKYTSNGARNTQDVTPKGIRKKEGKKSREGGLLLLETTEKDHLCFAKSVLSQGKTVFEERI